VPSGFAKLDKMTGGLQNSDLIIIAGRPGMGKTSFALNVAVNAAMKQGTSVAVFSLEMARDQLIRRMLSSEARVDAGKLRAGMLSSDEMDRLIQAAGFLAETRIFVDDTGALPVMELRAKARRLKTEADLGLVIIDYLQLMRGPKNVDNREQEISYISQSLKALAKELDIPVIALSQLNRSVENRPGKDKRPQLSDLRESGAIEQDADIIMFVYRDEVYNRDESDNKGVAEIIIGKQRNGPVGIVPCRFFHEFTRFENLAEDREF
jgi:replicative DNA helicase